MSSEADQAREIRRLLDCEQKRTDPFVTLQLSIDACTVNDVNKSFRKIALLLHPDKCKLPRCEDAFHVAERAHKLLSQEVVLTQLQRADAKRKEREAETRTHVPQPKPSVAPSPPSATAPPFGTLSKLAASGLSSDEQKTAEIQRVLAAAASAPGGRKASEPFIVLDVDPASCEVADVHRHYRRMAQALHPDKCDLPGVTDAFTVFEKAHKELADERALVRFKLAYQQQQRKEAALLQQQQQQHVATSGSSSGTFNNMSVEERLRARKDEALREHQLRAARTADEAAQKRRRVETEEAERQELAADLERQRKQWRDLELF